MIPRSDFTGANYYTEAFDMVASTATLLGASMGEHNCTKKRCETALNLDSKIILCGQLDFKELF